MKQIHEEHSHGPDPALTNVLRIKKVIKDRAEMTMEVIWLASYLFNSHPINLESLSNKNRGSSIGKPSYSS
jgi:hypothetical protein